MTFERKLKRSGRPSHADIWGLSSVDLARRPVMSQEEVVEGLRPERWPGPGCGWGLGVIASTSERIRSEMESRRVTAAASHLAGFLWAVENKL